METPEDQARQKKKKRVHVVWHHLAVAAWMSRRWFQKWIDGDLHSWHHNSLSASSSVWHFVIFHFIFHGWIKSSPSIRWSEYKGLVWKVAVVEMYSFKDRLLIPTTVLFSWNFMESVSSVLYKSATLLHQYQRSCLSSPPARPHTVKEQDLTAEVSCRDFSHSKR